MVEADCRDVAGRLAPSPTGPLHLGNAWAFLLAWLSARSGHGKIFLRIEDIDTARSRPGYVDLLLQDLRWLGLDWDPCGGADFITQTHRSALYQDALERLRSQGLAYPCFCTRRDLKTLASAPHGLEGVYPGICRDRPDREQLLASGRPHSWRFRCPVAKVEFEDLLLGAQSMDIRHYGGDFPILRGDGMFSYQLATALDDALLGISEVVRGHDLLTSTPRQLLLQRALSLPSPAYAHIPLLLNEEGERLAKRHASLSLASLRESGVRPEAVVGLLAHLAGLQTTPSPAKPVDLIEGFAWARVVREDIRLTPTQLACLHQGA